MVTSLKIDLRWPRNNGFFLPIPLEDTTSTRHLFVKGTGMYRISSRVFLRLCISWCYVLPIWSVASKLKKHLPKHCNTQSTTKYPIPHRQTSLQWSINSDGKLFFRFPLWWSHPTNEVAKYPPRSLTASLPLKNDGWKTILSCWEGNF